MLMISVKRSARLTPITPKKLYPEVAEFCRSISSRSPKYVLVIPDPRAAVNDCHRNVLAKIETDGGSIVSGRTIWHSKGNAIQGEFHSIWESPDGDWIDITPKRDGETKILFLPTDEKWEGRILPNIRCSLRKGISFEAQL